MTNLLKILIDMRPIYNKIQIKNINFFVRSAKAWAALYLGRP
jgi:hypothetical protein